MLLSLILVNVMAADITQAMTVLSVLTLGDLPDIVAAALQISATIVDMDGFGPGAGEAPSTRPTSGLVYPRQ